MRHVTWSVGYASVRSECSLGTSDDDRQIVLEHTTDYRWIAAVMTGKAKLPGPLEKEHAKPAKLG